MADHCVKLYLKLSDINYGTTAERERIMKFEDALGDAIAAARAGEFDGNDFGKGECILYMYGSNADMIFEAIQPAIREYAELTKGGFAIKRYGPPEDGIREVKIDL